MLRLKVCVLFSDVCGDLAPSLLSGDVPEAAVPSGEGKRDTPPPHPPPPALQHRTAVSLLADHSSTTPPPTHLSIISLSHLRASPEWENVFLL